MTYKSDVNNYYEFLSDLTSHKEFGSLLTEKYDVDLTKLQGFVNIKSNKLAFDGLNFHGGQLFISSFINPVTPFKRLLIMWQTGNGKTLAALLAAFKFLEVFGKTYKDKKIIFLGFTKSVVENEFFTRPELGFISEKEIKIISALREMISKDKDNKDLQKRLSMIQTIVRKRFVGKKRGTFMFFGFKEFANNLFFMFRDPSVSDEILSGNDSSEILKKIQYHIDQKKITINKQLLDMFSNNFIIIDEVHNIYNSRQQNQYGIAIQYILNYYGISNDAPRCLFMSATPMGFPNEIVPLLNLLVPIEELPEKRMLQRSDIFNSSGFISESGKKIIIDSIKGKISFMMDKNREEFPDLIFEGETITIGDRTLPYFKFIKCNTSKFFHNTLKSIAVNDVISLPFQYYSLYDFVFPNPNSEEIGLYNSAEIGQILDGASQEWKNKVGLIIEDKKSFPHGNFLHVDNIGKYSSKYKHMIIDLKETISKKKGKIILFHDKIKTTGIGLISKILQQNGFLHYGSIPSDDTICLICSKELKSHNNSDHEFNAVTFIEINSSLDKKFIYEKIHIFNSPDNLYGNNILIFLSSRMIIEGYDFKAIRNIFIMTFPGEDVSSLIQLIGRGIRRNSAVMLKPEERNVSVRIYITIDEVYPLEFNRYYDKIQSFLQIQEIEKYFHIYAIDSWLNTPTNKQFKTFDVLDYDPFFKKTDVKVKIEDKLTTFDIYGYNNGEITLVKNIIKKLFSIRPVWSYEDLFSAVKIPGLIKNNVINTEYITEETFAVALRNLCQNKNQITSIESDGENSFFNISDNFFTIDDSNLKKKIISVSSDNVFYYILTSANQDINSLYPECYIRTYTKQDISYITLDNFINYNSEKNFFTSFLNEIENNYNTEEKIYNILMKPYNNQQKLLELFLTDKKLTPVLTNIKNLYINLGFFIKLSDVNESTSENLNVDKSSEYIGYILKNIPHFYIIQPPGFKKFSQKILKYQPKYINNNIITGIAIDEKFKLTEQTNTKSSDSRQIKKGIVCLSYKKNHINEIFEKLGIKKINSNMKNICSILYITLIKKEIEEVKNKSDIKWIYTIKDIPDGT